MIANALRLEIERYASRMRADNPLFARAAEGTLTAVHTARYLANARFLISHTQPHLALAARLAVEASDDKLVMHFLHKAGEELGHESWADKDLSSLRTRLEIQVGEEPIEAMTDMVRFIEATIRERPALYLSYILFAEYLIVLLGDEWLALLEERCGVSRQSMTVIANHAELDREHTEEALDEIDGLVDDPRMLGPMRAVLLASIEHFHRFSIDIVARGDEDLRTRGHVQAPAA